MATGIKDKVAIVGMGCSKFGERWNCGTEHLLAEADRRMYKAKHGPKTALQPTFRSDLGRLGNSLGTHSPLLIKGDPAIANSRS